MSPFPGKPPEVKIERAWRQFRVRFKGRGEPEIIEADRIRFDEGYVTFWEVLDGSPYDHLILALSSRTVESVEEP